jgi:hypothetical protein
VCSSDLDSAATARKRAELRAARLAESVPVSEWWQRERARVVARDFAPEVNEMYEQSISFAKFHGEFTRFWQLPADAPAGV